MSCKRKGCSTGNQTGGVNISPYTVTNQRRLAYLWVNEKPDPSEYTKSLSVVSFAETYLSGPRTFEEHRRP